VDATRRLSKQRAEISRLLEVFRTGVDADIRATLENAVKGGASSTLEQLGVTGVMQRTDMRTLLAIENFATNKITEITRTAQTKIDTALTQHLLGVQSLDETVSQIDKQLGGGVRGRAMTIAYTEVGRAYSAAQYDQMLAQAKVLPGLKKRWIHSGKAHPRPGHVLCAEQTKASPIPIDQPFDIFDKRTGEVEQLMYPRDPSASAFNTINCGCMMVAVPPDPSEHVYVPLTSEQIAAAQPRISDGFFAPPPPEE
jgi:hypothetical protein